MDNSPLISPIITISRSFSRKVMAAKFEPEDVFASISAQCLVQDFDAASAHIYGLAKRVVLADIRNRLAEEFSLAESVSGPLETALIDGPPEGFSDPKNTAEREEAKAAAQAVAAARIEQLEQEKLNSGVAGSHDLQNSPSSGQPKMASMASTGEQVKAETGDDPSRQIDSRPEGAKSDVLVPEELSTLRQPGSEEAGKGSQATESAPAAIQPPHPVEGEKPGKTSRKRTAKVAPSEELREALGAALRGELTPDPKPENPTNGYIAKDDDVPPVIATPKYASAKEEVEKTLALIASVGPDEPRKTTEACTSLMRGFFQRGIPEATEDNIRQFRILLKFCKALSQKKLLLSNPSARGYDLKAGMTQCASLLVGRSPESKDVFWDAVSAQYPEAPEKILESVSPDMLQHLDDAGFTDLFWKWRITPAAGEEALLKGIPTNAQ